MAIRAFALGPIRGLQQAEASDLPNLVVVAGPNGSGKSTLLHTLYQQRAALSEPGTRVSYLGPHRGWRRLQLATSTLSEFQPGFSSYLELDAVPGWQQYQPRGLQHVGVGQIRDPGGLDESFSFVKPGISKLEDRQQRLVRQTWANQGQRLEPGDVPDLLDPLRRLVRALLPHLMLDNVDVSNPADLRVLFRRVDGPSDSVVELDDLSSGEKAVVGLMLPFVEDEANRLTGEAPTEGATPTMIIDEPETHLHPTLQVLLIDYLTDIATRGGGQFILATQSPSILDSLSDFFLLAPRAAVPDGNQFTRITDVAGRLEAMRGLTGSTHVLTRCRPIVYIEGERPASRPVSDQRLIELLIPQAGGWVLVAAQGRAEVARSARRLRQAMAEEMPGIPVFGLVDRDRAAVEDEDYVVSWPVAMVENLLLDPEQIWQLLAPSRERLSLGGPGDVDRELRRIAGERREDEIRLRVASLQRPVSERVRPAHAADVNEAVANTRASLERQLDRLLADEALREEFAAAERSVQEILDASRELDAFRGKEILRAFYDQHAKHAGYAYHAFTLTLAQHVARTPRTHDLTAEAVRRIEFYVPSDGVAAAEEAQARLTGTPSEQQAADALRLAQGARRAWESPGAQTEDLEPLREAWITLARAVEEQDRPLAQRLRDCAAELGVRSSVVEY